MPGLEALDLLDVWEQGSARGTAARALLLLKRAHPDMPDEELAAMPLGTRDGLLFELRQQLFGPRLESIVRCPTCGDVLCVSVDTADLRHGGDPGRGGMTEWTTDQLSYRLRVPTAGDARDLEACGAPADVRRHLLERCVVEARRGTARIEPWQLTREETVAVGDLIARADPNAEIVLTTRCPSCAHTWENLLDIASFLWSELEAHVRRLVVEVHTLALAYSWSERDILAMSARRREMYLEELRSR
jgi:hypothetical protein